MSGTLIARPPGSYQARYNLEYIEENLRHASELVAGLRAAGVTDVIPADEHGEPNVVLIGGLRDAIEALNFSEPPDRRSGSFAIRYQWPKVTAWCVMRKSGERHTSCWAACLSRTQADAFRDAWGAKEHENSRRNQWTPDSWWVELRAEEARHLMQPGEDPVAHVARSGAFTR